MMKRAMGLLLAVVMMLTMVISANAAAFTDIEGKDCANAVNVLTTLGVLEGRSETEFAPDAGLTRAEMATILVRLMGSEGASVSEDIFTDVTSGHWAYSNIAIAYKSGLVLGMGDGTFAPDQNVTTVQMIKMLICALGYDVQAEQQGGYPSGYYAKAAQLGMLDGVSTEMNASATRGIMAMVLYNTVDLPLFDQATFGAGASGVYVESADTLLSRYMDIYTLEGVVTSNYLTSLQTPERACAADEVAIDKVIYEMGDTAANEFLGMKVKAYYAGTRTTESVMPVLLYVAPAKVAKAVEFVSTDITADTTAKKLVYEIDGKESNVAIEDGATLIVNGQVKEAAITAADLRPTLGTVTLICNNGISADVVSVWDYTNYTVQSKNADKKEVYLMDEETPLVIDPTDKTVRGEFVTSEGEAFDASGVEKWNILSVAKSADNSVIRIVKNSTSVSGKIAEKDDKAVIIDGVEYTVAAGIEIPDVNTTAKFYLDFMGNIAEMDTNIATGLKYGYLAGAQYAKGIDGAASFKIFTQEGEMKTFPAAAKVTLNGENRKNTEVLDYIPERDKYTNTGDENGSTIKQLIKYSVNEAGEINELATANNATGYIDEYAGDAGFNMVLNLNFQGNNQKLTYSNFGTPITTTETSATHYIHNLRLLGANMIVNASTLIFKIPGEDAADEDYKLVAPVNFPHREALPFVTGYDLTESRMLGAICWDLGPVGGSADKMAKYWSSMETPHGLITSISKSLNKDMVSEYNITLVDWTGNVQKVKAREDLPCGTKVANVGTRIENDKYEENSLMRDCGGIYPDKLRAGDMIRFEKDAAGYLTVAAITYRASDPGMREYSITQGGGIVATTSSSIYVGGDLLSNGIVKMADANGIICETELIRTNATQFNNSTGKVTRVFPTPSKIMLFEKDTCTTKAISVNDIVAGDEYLNLWRTITPFIFWIIR